MSKKLAFAIDPVNAHLRDPITTYFQAKGWGVWHWLPDLWLLTEVPDNLTTRMVWEMLSQNPLFPNLRGMVLGFDPSMPYWGGISSEAWPWMVQKWGVPG